MYHYESWDVYQALLELREIAAKLSRKRFPGYAPDLLQLNRAASSAVANLAEGAREQQPGHKLERYRTTLSSVSECNGVLTVLSRAFPHEELVAEGRSLCERASAMMTNLIRSVERSRGMLTEPPRRVPSDEPPTVAPAPTRNATATDAD
ncbi:MAG: four helix bundle protein [Longimicrobiales bacterium]